MKKIITSTLIAAAACLAQQAGATPVFNQANTTGSSGEQVSSTSFVYGVSPDTVAPVYTTVIVQGQEQQAHGVLADTTFTVPNGVASAKLGAIYNGVNNSALEASLAANSTSVSNPNNAVQSLSNGDNLHILLQNTAGSKLNAGATTVTYNVTTYTD